MSKPYNEKLEITCSNLNESPKYIRDDIKKHRLEFEVMKVSSCSEYFDKGFIIFKFQSKEFPSIIRYTGNNPNI